MTGPPLPAKAGVAGRQSMQNADDKAKSNIRLAIILGLVAVGFFLIGMYMAVNKGG